MKILVPLSLTSALIVSACAGTPQNQANAKSAAALPLAHSYRCESGETVSATYPTTDSATVQYKGKNYNMHIAVSGSGSRYVGGELEWWTKGSGLGSEGSLFRHRADGASGESIERCTRA